LEKVYVDWKYVELACEMLSTKIRNDGFKPDVLVGLSRGGLVPVRILSDMLGVDRVDIIRVKSYNNTEKVSKPVIEDSSCKFDFNDKHILVVDDVSDTGDSLNAVKQFILARYQPKSVRFLTIHYKPHSTFEPNYYAEKTTEWIVYPWEKNEAMGKSL